jgi:hypothetical protein
MPLAWDFSGDPSVMNAGVDWLETSAYHAEADGADMAGRRLSCVVKDSRLLVAVSAAQLAFGLSGMAVAVRRRRAFDLPFWAGQEATVGRDALLMGTALSAPAMMLGAQGCATAALAWQPTLAAERVLGGLGAVMVAGYLSERLVRRRLLPSGWDAAETPIATAGISLAAVMALLGLRGRRKSSPCLTHQSRHVSASSARLN